MWQSGIRLALGVIIFLCVEQGSIAKENRQIVGADVSALPQLEAAGVRYSDDQGQADLLVILQRNGFNAIRLRVWNQPGQDLRFPANQSGPEGYSSPAQVVAMAKRAQALGLDVLIDFHYSDWWADPGKQYVPVAWEAMTVPQMTQALGEFTRQTLMQLKQAAYLTRLGQAVAGVPGGQGIFYWAPEWIPSPQTGSHAVTGWDNATLFDFKGRALPGLAALGRAGTP